MCYSMCAGVCRLVPFLLSEGRVVGARVEGLYWYAMRIPTEAFSSKWTRQGRLGACTRLLRAFVVAVIGWLAVWKFGLREEHRLHEKHDGDATCVLSFGVFVLLCVPDRWPFQEDTSEVQSLYLLFRRAHARFV